MRGVKGTGANGYHAGGLHDAEWYRMQTNMHWGTNDPHRPQWLELAA